MRPVEETRPAARPSKSRPLQQSYLAAEALRFSLASELSFVKSAYPTIAGFSVYVKSPQLSMAVRADSDSSWAAGAFDTTYVLTVTPNADGSDQPLWVDAVKPNLP